MLIYLTRAQMEPIVRRLRRYGTDDKYRPSRITPRRWAAILAGKTCRLEWDELNAIAHYIGWQVVLDETKRKKRK